MQVVYFYFSAPKYIMEEIIKVQNLLSILDSFKFGGYSKEEVINYIELLINNSSSLLLECLLFLKFNNFTDEINNIDYYILIVKEYQKKLLSNFNNFYLI